MTLTVIIVNYNVKHYISQCLDSIAEAVKGIDAEVIVVDNHSSDGSVPYLRSRYPSIRIMASSHNLGFSRANNIALRIAKGEFVLLLNPDTIVEEDTFKSCIQFMREHDDCGAIGVCQLQADGKKAPESRRGLPTPMTSFYKIAGLTAKYPKHRKFAKYYMSYLPWDEPAEIDVISGAFLFARRKTITEAGMLDEDYFMYGEDIDLSYCMQMTGMKNYFLPINILHYKGESTVRSSFKYVHVFYQAMLIFFSKHFASMSALLKIPITTAIYGRAFIALCSTLLHKTKKMMGFDARRNKRVRRYYFIVTKEHFDQCLDLANDNALEAEFITLDTKYSAQLLKDLNHQKFQQENIDAFIVYDTSAFSFTEILENFAEQPLTNVYLGTYNPKENIIITHNDCFTSL